MERVLRYIKQKKQNAKHIVQHKALCIIFFFFKGKVLVFFLFFWLFWVFIAVCGLLVVGFSLVVVCGLQSAWVQLFSCPVACGILVPPPGIEPASPALEGRFLTTGPPGKSLYNLLKRYIDALKNFLKGYQEPFGKRIYFYTV